MSVSERRTAAQDIKLPRCEPLQIRTGPQVLACVYHYPTNTLINQKKKAPYEA